MVNVFCWNLVGSQLHSQGKTLGTKLSDFLTFGLQTIPPKRIEKIIFRNQEDLLSKWSD